MVFRICFIPPQNLGGMGGGDRKTPRNQNHTIYDIQ
jgi:hypothetical protein